MIRELPLRPGAIEDLVDDAIFRAAILVLAYV